MLLSSIKKCQIRNKRVLDSLARNFSEFLTFLLSMLFIRYSSVVNTS